MCHAAIAAEERAEDLLERAKALADGEPPP
jgi:hypothetical protein